MVLKHFPVFEKFEKRDNIARWGARNRRATKVMRALRKKCTIARTEGEIREVQAQQNWKLVNPCPKNKNWPQTKNRPKNKNRLGLSTERVKKKNHLGHKQDKSGEH